MPHYRHQLPPAIAVCHVDRVSIPTGPYSLSTCVPSTLGSTTEPRTTTAAAGSWCCSRLHRPLLLPSPLLRSRPDPSLSPPSLRSSPLPSLCPSSEGLADAQLTPVASDLQISASRRLRRLHSGTSSLLPVFLLFQLSLFNIRPMI